MPHTYILWLFASGLLWTLTFVLFLWAHTPMLIAPRVGGRLAEAARYGFEASATASLPG
jgi:hypothetical protein